ncbi:nmrA-like family protein [Zymoseptoria brevis]|uniref:NmrA-like family protein n=1 Tax=Zymoseptoria brevis TaxID=1047168 RepID=A0A0F4GEV9_9PEZI|nr:nmrA-like family protein [Zymoseptoria brevis]
MVKVALAGGTGGLGREVIDALLAKNRHEIIVLTRQDPAQVTLPNGVQAVQLDYKEKSSIVDALKGVETVFSFIITGKDPGNVAQKNLIDACVEAKVKRFAPSEWTGASSTGTPWYAGKAAIAAYLQEINAEKKVLEYCRFMPGFALDYLAYPHQICKHFTNLGFSVDIFNCRAFSIKDAELDRFGMTLVEDMAAVAAEAVDYPGEWPVDGGMRAVMLSFPELVEIGERLRGKKFDIEYVTLAQARAGRLPTSWVSDFNHAAIPEQLRDSWSRTFNAKVMYSVHLGNYAVSDTWNRLLPDFRFTGLEEFLQKYY